LEKTTSFVLRLLSFLLLLNRITKIQCKMLTEGWGSKIYILFPEFNQDKYGESVEEIKSKFIDKTFIYKIEVDTFNKDFRNV
jgi:hypothetical protein